MYQIHSRTVDGNCRQKYMSSKSGQNCLRKEKERKIKITTRTTTKDSIHPLFVVLQYCFTYRFRHCYSFSGTTYVCVTTL